MSSLINPATHYVAVTKSDTTVLKSFSALYVGTTGDIAVKDKFGVAVVFTAVPVGVLPVSGDNVQSTGTTASNIVALYN